LIDSREVHRLNQVMTRLYFRSPV